MELEVQGFKCKKVSHKSAGQKRALHISLYLHNPSFNIQWKSARPKSTGLILKPKKNESKLKNSKLDSLFPNLQTRPQKILSKTPTPLRSPQKSRKKGKISMYSPKNSQISPEISVFSCFDTQNVLKNALNASLNIEKMQFSPKLKKNLLKDKLKK
jgi:hypothetical protein